jgi:Fur family peroxide stress response transcriptional regulator
MNRDAAARLKNLEDVCREHGLALTHQRRAVLEALLLRSDHPTADQIFEEVRKQAPRISRRTVYRVLDTLAELELIRRVHHPGASARFDAKTHRHHHVMCLRCGKIRDLENSDLDSIPLPKGKPLGFKVCDFSVQLMGVCPECRADESK